MLSQYVELKTIILHKTKMALEEEEEDNILKINVCVISGRYGGFTFHFGFLSIRLTITLFDNKPFRKYAI